MYGLGEFLQQDTQKFQQVEDVMVMTPNNADLSAVSPKEEGSLFYPGVQILNPDLVKSPRQAKQAVSLPNQSLRVSSNFAKDRVNLVSHIHIDNKTSHGPY
jgi:hypothetical protein